MFDGRFRHQVERVVKPVGEQLRRTKLSPDHLTLIGLFVACGAAVAIGLGALRLGLLLVVLAALPDLLTVRWPRRPTKAVNVARFLTQRLIESPMRFCWAAWRGSWLRNEARTRRFCLCSYGCFVTDFLPTSKSRSLGFDSQGWIDGKSRAHHLAVRRFAV